ncbi:protein UL91 [Elephantid betaherpesvirus 1]|uniref:Protein U62 n=34 Tax=Elephantid herpesvirus 1 TaxID=146015 RepID=U62_ELHVK|nr:RecName: Full=Protein U62 [Elephantid herpesvirus 1 (isolate Kiba)]ABG36583.1 U62 [Elephantid betaherpesvirus 1]AGE09948.1 protein UL91 [Elephantid betaherpesvirus 1]ALL73713.1 protein U62 [Elephant endotheliotropic herpesvirus 1B]
MNDLIQSLKSYNVIIKDYAEYIKFLDSSTTGFGFVSTSVSKTKQTEEVCALFDCLGLECILDIKRAAGDLKDGRVPAQHDAVTQPADS